MRAALLPPAIWFQQQPRPVTARAIVGCAVVLAVVLMLPEGPGACGWALRCPYRAGERPVTGRREQLVDVFDAGGDCEHYRHDYEETCAQFHGLAWTCDCRCVPLKEEHAR